MPKPKPKGSKTISGAVKRFEKELAVYKPSYLAELDNSKLARSISGTSDKKSAAYKNVIRNIQRWNQGTRTPNKENRAAIVDYIKKIPDLRRKLFKPDKRIKVTLNAKIKYSEDLRQRTIAVEFEPDRAKELFDLSRESDQDAEDYFFEEYGFIPEEIRNPSWLITWA